MKLEEKRIETQSEIEGAKLGAKLSKEKEELDTRNEIEGTKLGYAMAKDKEKTYLELLKIAAAADKPTKGD